MAKTKGARSAAGSPPAAESGLSLNHLRRETRTALELAVVALAPSKIIERLDTGGDGTIAWDEFQTGIGAPAPAQTA